MSRPIPKNVLCHSCILTTEFNADKWGNAVLFEPVNLEFVRFEPCSKYVINNNAEYIGLSGVLFFDCYNSSPKSDKLFLLSGDMLDGNVCKHQQIEFCGRSYTVQTIELLYDKRKPHHYEIGVC